MKWKWRLLSHNAFASVLPFKRRDTPRVRQLPYSIQVLQVDNEFTISFNLDVDDFIAYRYAFHSSFSLVSKPQKRRGRFNFFFFYFWPVKILINESFVSRTMITVDVIICVFEPVTDIFISDDVVININTMATLVHIRAGFVLLALCNRMFPIDKS